MVKVKTFNSVALETTHELNSTQKVEMKQKKPKNLGLVWKTVQCWSTQSQSEEVLLQGGWDTGPFQHRRNPSHVHTRLTDLFTDAEQSQELQETFPDLQEMALHENRADCAPIFAFWHSSKPGLWISVWIAWRWPKESEGMCKPTKPQMLLRSASRLKMPSVPRFF